MLINPVGFRDWVMSGLVPHISALQRLLFCRSLDPCISYLLTSSGHVCHLLCLYVCLSFPSYQLSLSLFCPYRSQAKTPETSWTDRKLDLGGPIGAINSQIENKVLTLKPHQGSNLPCWSCFSIHKERTGQPSPTSLSPSGSFSLSVALSLCLLYPSCIPLQCQRGCPRPPCCCCDGARQRVCVWAGGRQIEGGVGGDRKSTRLNSSHL